MKFAEWIQNKNLNDKVSCCVINEESDSPYIDFQGKLGEIPVDKYGCLEVICPALIRHSGQTPYWLIDLA